MTDLRDPLLGRAIEELREIPDVERATIERVAAAAAAARLSTAEDDALETSGGRRGVWLWASAALATALAAALGGFVVRGSIRQDETVPTSARASAAAMTPVAASAAIGALPIAQQFVFNDRGAHRVSVVGDFNGWNPASAPMTRSPDGDMWSLTIPVLPGRHMFGYMVDDSVFLLDPRMPKARDPDLGTEGSIVIVGRP